VKAFGGAADDEIYGDAGQDIILGDFGYYNAEGEILPFQNYASDIHSPEYSGDDEIFGGDDDDFIMGQEVRFQSTSKHVCMITIPMPKNSFLLLIPFHRAWTSWTEDPEETTSMVATTFARVKTQTIR
jgi:hypothetical protein